PNQRDQTNGAERDLSIRRAFRLVWPEVKLGSKTARTARHRPHLPCFSACAGVGSCRWRDAGSTACRFAGTKPATEWGCPVLPGSRERKFLSSACSHGELGRVFGRNGIRMATASTAIEPTVKVSATKLLINNKWTDAASSKTFPTINPATG